MNPAAAAAIAEPAGRSAPRGLWRSRLNSVEAVAPRAVARPTNERRSPTCAAAGAPASLRPMRTGDGLLVRLHPPGGALSAEQARAVAAAARLSATASST